MSLETLGKFLSESRIIGRLTASGAIFSGIYIINQYFTATDVNPEVLAVGASVVSAAGVFLFMSEK